MPNLLPDWHLTLPWDLGLFDLRAAGRMIWAILLLVVGVTVVFLLIKPPFVKRPFSTAVGIALFPAILIVGLLAGKLLPDIQRSIVWLTIFAIIGHTFLMVASREPRDPERSATWSECFAGSLGVFALFTLAYAIIPSEWLTFANSDLQWGDNTKFVFKSNEDILGLVPVHYPFNLDYPALRDIVVTLIYVAVLGLNVYLWVKWQSRNQVAAAPEGGEAVPERRSRFGRPLQRFSRRAPEAATAGTPEPVPEGA